jgi:hypothetical protein
MSVTAPTTLYKQPSEVRTYTMDFTNLLSSTGTIQSILSLNNKLRGGGESSLQLSASGIVEEGKKINFVAASGEHRNTYRIEIVILSNDGQTLEGDGLLTVTNI